MSETAAQLEDISSIAVALVRDDELHGCEEDLHVIRLELLVFGLPFGLALLQTEKEMRIETVAPQFLLMAVAFVASLQHFEFFNFPFLRSQLSTRVIAIIGLVCFFLTSAVKISCVPNSVEAPVLAEFVCKNAALCITYVSTMRHGRLVFVGFMIICTISVLWWHRTTGLRVEFGDLCEHSVYAWGAMLSCYFVHNRLRDRSIQRYLAATPTPKQRSGVDPELLKEMARAVNRSGNKSSSRPPGEGLHGLRTPNGPFSTLQGARKGDARKSTEDRDGSDERKHGTGTGCSGADDQKSEAAGDLKTNADDPLQRLSVGSASNGVGPGASSLASSDRIDKVTPLNLDCGGSSVGKEKGKSALGARLRGLDRLSPLREIHLGPRGGPLARTRVSAAALQARVVEAVQGAWEQTDDDRRKSAPFKIRTFVIIRKCCLLGDGSSYNLNFSEDGRVYLEGAELYRSGENLVRLSRAGETNYHRIQLPPLNVVKRFQGTWDLEAGLFRHSFTIKNRNWSDSFGRCGFLQALATTRVPPIIMLDRHGLLPDETDPKAFLFTDPDSGDQFRYVAVSKKTEHGNK